MAIALLEKYKEHCYCQFIYTYCTSQVVVAVPATVIAHELHVVVAFDLVLSIVTTVLKSSIPGCKVIQVHVYAFLHDVEKAATAINDKIIFFILICFMFNILLYLIWLSK